ncbi:MAG: hypothetical protein ND895_04310 [Pyrinomonadaceae bacterium]|nr:hypothetical protein [Pyrinomonadaceae bacterium]
MCAHNAIESNASRPMNWLHGRRRQLMVEALSLAIVSLLCVGFLRLSQAALSSRTFLVFGPANYVRERGAPASVTNHFTAARPGAEEIRPVWNYLAR